MEFVVPAVNNGIQPKETASGSLVLRSGRRYVTLVKADGTKTEAGGIYEQRSGQALPSGGVFNPETRAYREGNTEYIRDRAGKERVTRLWDPATNEYRFTALGRAYYSRKRSIYVVHVPVNIEGHRKNGSTYTLKTFMPIEKMGLQGLSLPQTLTQRQRDARVKAEVLKHIAPGQVLYEVSDERWTYDQSGTWKISEQTVQVRDNDEPTVTTRVEEDIILERRVGAKPSLSQLPFPEGLCAEAFEEHDDMLCCPRQIAAVLKRDLGEVCSLMDDAERALYGTDSWRERGCTPRMVLEFARAQGLGACILHEDRVVSTLPGPLPLVCAVHENHCYFYECKKARRALMRRAEARPSEKLRREAKSSSKTPPFAEWLPWQGEFTPGHYWAPEEDMDAVRAQFLATGRHPRLVLKDEASARSLVYTCSRRDAGLKGAITVHSVPERAQEIQAWLERLGGMTNSELPYRGEGLPSISHKVLLHLLRQRERVYLTGDQKAALLDEYAYKCALCGCAASSFEWDHKLSLATCLDQQTPEAFWPLCPACHAQKTCDESRAWDSDILASHFEKGVWEQYVESPRPPPLVWRCKECTEVEGCEIADVRRCRKRALEFNAHPVPVFSPLDRVEPVEDCVLGDINFVDRPATNVVHQLGYTPGWQHRVQTEFLLHMGVIGWADVRYRLTATAHFPADVFRRPLRLMEEAWAGASGPLLSKLSVNSLIGLWCLDDAFSYQVTSSSHEGDAPPGPHIMRTFHYEGGNVVHDFVVKTRLANAASHRPLHDLCMGTEAVRMGQMVYALKRQRCAVLELKTDSVLYRPPKRAKVCLAQLEFQHLHLLRNRFEGANARLDEHCALTPVESSEPVFRVQAAVERDLLRIDPAPPARDATQLAVPASAFRDLTPEQGAEAVLCAGQSLLVLGVAGTGKTTFLRGVVERLRAAGQRVAVISKTHCASARAGGCTADYFVRRHVLHGACNADVIWIDEISQIDAALWAQLNKLTYTKVRWLLSGDFAQFPALFSSFRGCPVPEDAFERSNLLHRLCDGNCVTLTECRRSDAELFEWYSSLIPGGARFVTPLPEVLAEARARFAFAGRARHNLVIAHRRRVQLNRELNRHFAPESGTVFLRVEPQRGQLNAAQSMWLWPGIELLGCCQAEKKGIRNGVLYTVESIDQEQEQVCLAGGLELSFQQVKAWLRLSFAQTYASCQGSEFEGTLRLHDTAHLHFTRRHLFVGLSRARAAELVSVVA